MKTKITKSKKSSCSFWLIILFAFSIHRLPAQENSLNKTFSWEFIINPDAEISLDNYDCDLEITNLTGAKIIFELEINAESEKPENIRILENYLQGLQFEHSVSSVKLSTKIWESLNSKNLIGINRMVMKLSGGNSIQLKEFKSKARLKLPVTAALKLNTRYSDIHMASTGRLILDSYDDNIYGTDVTGNTDITGKYSEMEFNHLGNLNLNSYDCEFKTERTADSKIISKYSGIKIRYGSAFRIESYDDEFDLLEIGDLHFNAKYSGLRAEKAGHVTTDLYDSDLAINTIDNIQIHSSKYSKFTMKKSGDWIIHTTFDDEMICQAVNSIKVTESKYSDFKINRLQSEFIIVSGYDDNISIEQAGSEFKLLDCYEKYGDINITVPEDISLNIDWETQYGNLDFDKNRITTKIYIKDSGFRFLGFKGTDSETNPSIKIRGYDVKLSLALD